MGNNRKQFINKYWFVSVLSTCNSNLMPSVVIAQAILERYKACDPLDGYERVRKFVEEDLKKSIEVCKLCAFDKQKDNHLPNIPFTLDPNFKKKFRNIPIKAI